MRRREFIALVGGATAAWPLAVRAQQAMPVIGYLGTRSLESDAHLVAMVRQGLAEAGFVEGQNLQIEYRFAGGRTNPLSAMAADLVGRRVTVIVASAGPAMRAAKEATTTIPIVFSLAEDPVNSGVVASLNHPGGNLTGVTTFASELGTKQFGLLQELVPAPAVIGYLLDTTTSASASEAKSVETAARAFGRQSATFKVHDERDIDAAFMSVVKQRIGGIVVSSGAFFGIRLNQIVVLANHYAIPTLYPRREYAIAGGLMSYGTSFVDAYHQVGMYVGRILRGAQPADLPVLRPTKFEFVINLQTARLLGIAVPPPLLATADEVIE
jgi:putative ABC transport system substrate-binding protein